MTFADYLNLFFFDYQEGVGGVLRALQQKGAFQSLAEPNLIAYNDQEASFLAGGEFPVPIVQGAGNASTVTVQFKEFGIRLNFTPTIAGDVIRLKVRPEVSTLDFNNGVTLSGFRIPALTTRRAETDVELRDGQSFAIAGLLDNTTQDDACRDSDPEQAADHRQPLQEQGGALRTDGVDGPDHAEARATPQSGRGAAAADHHSSLHQARGRRPAIRRRRWRSRRARRRPNRSKPSAAANSGR